jgi:CheY-like chemotaxis protein
VEPLVVECADQPRTVLVVDDNACMRRLVTAALGREGYRVVVAADPDEAFAASEAEDRIDVLLTDFVLPGMSGFELAQSIAVRHPHAGLLYVSGYSAQHLADRGLAEGTVAFLQKPFSLVELAGTVGALCA